MPDIRFNDVLNILKRPDESFEPASDCEYWANGFCSINNIVCPHFKETFENCSVREWGHRNQVDPPTEEEKSEFKLDGDDSDDQGPSGDDSEDSSEDGDDGSSDDSDDSDGPPETSSKDDSEKDNSEDDEEEDEEDEDKKESIMAEDKDKKLLLDDDEEGVCQQCFGPCPEGEDFCCDDCEREYNKDLDGEQYGDDKDLEECDDVKESWKSVAKHAAVGATIGGAIGSIGGLAGTAAGAIGGGINAGIGGAYHSYKDKRKRSASSKKGWETRKRSGKYNPNAKPGQKIKEDAGFDVTIHGAERGIGDRHDIDLMTIHALIHGDVDPMFLEPATTGPHYDQEEEAAFEAIQEALDMGKPVKDYVVIWDRDVESFDTADEAYNYVRHLLDVDPQADVQVKTPFIDSPRSIRGLERYRWESRMNEWTGPDLTVSGSSFYRYGGEYYIDAQELGIDFNYPPPRIIVNFKDSSKKVFHLKNSPDEDAWLDYRDENGGRLIIYNEVE